MGWNTTVLLFNDHMDKWPEEIRDAQVDWRRHEFRKHHRGSGRFGWGQVISQDHADGDQVCVVGRNWGRYLTCISPAERPEDLGVLAELLRCHGYSVKAPGDKRAKPPLPWGYGPARET